MRRTPPALVVAALSCALSASASAQSGAQDSSLASVVIRAATILDGRGGRIANGGGAIVIRGARIVSVLRGAAAETAVRRASILYDLGGATVLPGLIDSHVHISSYINKAGRSHAPLLDMPNDGESEADMVIATADNLRATLFAGITTAQSIGKPEDVQYREAVKSGALLGPRLFTSLAPIAGPAFPLTEAQLTPEGLRAIVRQRIADGADVIKLFASKSIREGGVTTLRPDQLEALCGEAKVHGLRSIVHAHSAESIRLSVLAGCNQIEHGVFVTPEVLRLMAEHGTYFDPQCGLVFRNYFEHRDAFLGIGNFDTAGFTAMERALPLATNVIRQAWATPGLKLLWGTDATAGSNGRNVEDLICRVREGGEPAMSAIVAATSRNAEALGMGKEIGSIAPGYRADIIAVPRDPSRNIEALRDVQFVMLDGRVRLIKTPGRTATLALRGATVLTGTGDSIANATILIENGRVAAVGRSLAVPAGASVIDVRGKHIVPGFIDNHSHIGKKSDAPPPSSTFRMIDQLDEQDPKWSSALSGGVTTVVTGPSGGGGIGGEAVVIKTFGPSLQKRVLLENGGLKLAVGRRERPGMSVAAMLRDTFARAQEYVADWRRWESGGRVGTPPARSAALEPFARVLRHEDYIRVHVNAAHDILAILELKDEFGFDLALHHAIEAYKVLDEIAKRNVDVVALPLFLRIPLTEAALENAAAVKRAGIRVAFHQDDPVSRTKWLRLDAGMAMRYGMSEQDALAGLTSSAAGIARVAGRVGSIEPGKDADLVVLDGPWYELTTHVDLVLVDGVVAFDRAREQKP